MNVRFYTLSALPVANANAAGSFVNVTTGADKGMYYCDGTAFMKLDNVDQDRANEIAGADVDTATGIVSFYNGDSEALFTLDLSDYLAAEVAKLAGSATIASIDDGVVTIKAGVAEEDGVIDNNTDDDIVLAKVATTGKAEDIVLNPTVAFNGDSDPNNLTTVQDAIEALATGFDGLVTDVEGVVAAHADDDVAHITAEERTAWNNKQAALDNAAVLSGISADDITAWNNKQAALDNAAVLSGISAADISAWTAKQSAFDNAAVLSGITASKVSAWDAVATGSWEEAGTAAELISELGTAAAKNVLTGAIADADDSTGANLVTAAQVKTFAAGITGAMHFRDTVTGADAATALATITDAAAGDVALYGTQEYVYNGTEWKLFGDEGAYDASGAAATAETNAKAYADSLVSNANSHIANGDIHVTKAQKDTWDAKQAALSNATVLEGITASDITAWNSKQAALSNAAVLEGITASKVSAWDTVADGNWEVAGAAASALVSANAYADSLASNYDASGAAADALVSANAYADSLASNYDASGAAADALVSAKDYTDSALTWLTTWPTA